MQHRPARPTQKDIAVAAGVSQATVSIVLNKVATTSVPVATRERILKLAGEFGYQPNHPARILRSARTMTLACVVPDITNPFYPGLVRGLQTTAAPAGYAVLIYDTDGRPEGEKRALDWLQQGRADGAVGMFYHHRATDLAGVARRTLPLVLLGRQAAHRGPPIDSVFIDNVAASAAMTRWLIRRGHRRIAMIVAEYGPSRPRAEGYEKVMREAGLTSQLFVDTAYSAEAGVRAMQALLKEQDRPTAVFGANDMLAIGAMQAARDAGLVVPDDIAIVGFDDIPTADLLGLTTVRQPEFELGALAARTLMDRLQSGGMTPAAKNLELAFEIVERSSA
ncbi:MAG: LacI family DNA-binding transcriptional regulator [Proteobacteria bacterium]|nr:LacI family DNA-binding transcriptional regulator [Pseudomonadota bacterium]